MRKVPGRVFTFIAHPCVRLKATMIAESIPVFIVHSSSGQKYARFTYCKYSTFPNTSPPIKQKKFFILIFANAHGEEEIPGAGVPAERNGSRNCCDIPRQTNHVPTQKDNRSGSRHHPAQRPYVFHATRIWRMERLVGIPRRENGSRRRARRGIETGNT